MERLPYGPINLPPTDPAKRYVRNLPKIKVFGGKEFKLHDREKTTRSGVLKVAQIMRLSGFYARVVKESEAGSFREWVVYIREGNRRKS